MGRETVRGFVKFIGFEREAEAIEWAKARIGIAGPTGFCRAMSAVTADDQFAFVVVLSGFVPGNIDMHTASAAGDGWISPKATVRMFNAIFHYAFDEHKANRVTGLVRASNIAARQFDEHIGFQLEGVMRKAICGEDLYIYGFLAEEFNQHKWFRSSNG